MKLRTVLAMAAAIGGGVLLQRKLALKEDLDCAGVLGRMAGSGGGGRMA